MCQLPTRILDKRNDISSRVLPSTWSTCEVRRPRAALTVSECPDLIPNIICSPRRDNTTRLFSMANNNVIS